MSRTLEQRCVDTIRTLSMDAVQKANSGHPGMPMGMADVAFVLWTEFLRHSPANPAWVNRDRFILSAGHGSMLLYSLLHLTGYDLSLDEIKNFRQWGSKTPGHPERGLTPGVETTTGPLGQGFANGVGMAIAAKHLAAKSILDHHVYAIVSDGDLMEGVSQEAASLAGHLGLGNLIYLYDDNKITIDGSTDLAFTEDVLKRFEAYGWHTRAIDGHDRDAIRHAIAEAQLVSDKPSLIACRTHIGFGSPNKQDTEESHGSPLGEEEIRLTKQAYGWDPEAKFFIPDDVLAHFRAALEKGAALEADWNAQLADASPEARTYLEACFNRTAPDFTKLLPTYTPDPKGIASRKASGNALDAVGPHIPGVMGGTADLGGSNLTAFKGFKAVQKDDFSGNYVHYGVREHAMGSIMNGMSLHGSIVPYGGTFLVFSDYCRPAIRMAALMHVPAIYVFTHDSIGLGEDGPTHQPIEHLAALRAIPNNLVIRPADANETSAAWNVALSRTDGPTCLVLTRQNLPTFAETADSWTNVAKGAYVFAEAPSGKPDSIILATGSEIAIAYEAWKTLTASGKQVRLVSMPAWESFRKQSAAYKESVLPASVKRRVALEAASPFGWAEWVGDEGTVIALDHFGESAPFQTLYKEFGLTAEAVVAAVTRA
jgi:transketolase